MKRFMLSLLLAGILAIPMLWGMKHNNTFVVLLCVMLAAAHVYWDMGKVGRIKYKNSMHKIFTAKKILIAFLLILAVAIVQVAYIATHYDPSTHQQHEK